MFEFQGTPTTLTDDDFARAADALSVDPAAIRAVCSVETSGGGFLADGRPKILFEAHTFHLLTDGKYDDDFPNLSSSDWNRALYAQSTDHQFDRLEAAIQLDDEAALKSASWGLFQIMGENFAQCGFACVQDFVLAMEAGEGHHLDAFVAFVRHNAHLLTALQDKDWAAFALGYNGPGYAANHYDTKLLQAYQNAGGC